jgi:hypothetical protein
MITRLQKKRSESAGKIQHFFKAKKRRCPITLQPIAPGRAVTVGKTTYDATALAEYFSSTGDYRDPLSRAEIPDSTLHVVEMITGVRVLELKSKFEDERRRRLDLDNIYFYFENKCDTIVGKIVSELSDETNSQRKVLHTIALELRRLRIVLAAYRGLHADRADTLYSESVKTIRELTTFHIIAQHFVLQTMSGFF